VYDIRVLEGARQDLAALDRTIAARIVSRTRWLAAHASEIQPEPLTGDLAGLFKLRVGAYRVIDEILGGEGIIVIHAVGHRRDIYRRR
jgi:mRNA interferase RelE/StbE